MRRFRLLLANEFKLFRTAIPIHVVITVQPTILYLLMSVILVHPTFDMYVARPATGEGRALVAAMEEVASPIGLPYINPILVDWDGGPVTRQVVVVEKQEDADGVHPVAVQYYGLIDSNLVKNFRNRLTAAALILWNESLDARAVTVEQHPWLPHDVPYTVYFGMALLPLTASIAASVLGGALMAQEFEFGTILEYQLAPASPAWILGARLTRLVLWGLIAAGMLLVAIGLTTGAWPDSFLGVGLILVPGGLIASCLGVLAGLVFRKLIPAFLVGLVASFVGWLLGSAFGLAAGFGGLYELVSRFTPGTHAVELLFPRYFVIDIGSPRVSVLVLVLLSVGMVALTGLAYRWRVLRRA